MQKIPKQTIKIILTLFPNSMQKEKQEKNSKSFRKKTQINVGIFFRITVEHFSKNGGKVFQKIPKKKIKIIRKIFAEKMQKENDPD